MTTRTAKDRLIVALDMPTVEEAQRLVVRLGDTVSFYKVGLELLFAGGLDLATTVTDEHVIDAVRRLTTAGIDAGPCGAATWAAAQTLQHQPTAGLETDSVVVLISTEGQQANPLGDRT